MSQRVILAPRNAASGDLSYLSEISWWTLVGIEPMTSSMPWSGQNTKLLIIKWLEDGKTDKTGPIGRL